MDFLALDVEWFMLVDRMLNLLMQKNQRGLFHYIKHWIKLICLSKYGRFFFGLQGNSFQFVTFLLVSDNFFAFHKGKFSLGYKTENQ